ncbi:quorum-sensing autoinducer 2 sensor kinase/phosphatase LuxQ [Vibrio sp. NTOU-M3]|uniref:quorum-sensing autoinducer 2 sensor kinase/phosphatase LuxQ n=1 Tax=unclassified Vibrio TaxID=2614977 RepID=UPI00349F3ADA
MKIKFGQRGKPRRLATLIARSVFLTIGMLMLVVLLQNYQINKKVVEQEVARSKQQTSSLVQQIFNFRLQSIEITQNSYSRNESLIDALRSNNEQELNHFFRSLDQINPSLAPDFRFISYGDHVGWSDSNHEFYGIEVEELQHIVDNMSFVSSWHLTQAPSVLGMRYLMVRRAPIVQNNSGEVIGFLYVGIVLNNNFALLDSLLKGSNADEIFLSVGSEVIASTNRENLQNHIDWLEQYSSVFSAKEYMVSKTDLEINGVATFLNVYSVQDNTHIAELMKSHYLWAAVALAIVFIIAIASRYWLGHRVSEELFSLTRYTKLAFETQNIDRFPGSEIDEFNQIGLSFEKSFKRLNEQEKQFADLFNFSLSPITLWDTEGNLIRVNPAAERSFQLSSTDKSVYNLLACKLVPQITMCAKGATLTGVNVEIEDKTYRWNLSPIFIDNKIKHVMVQGQDVTSFVRAEQQSAAAKEEAEESARVRADFLARMSHELRTPLNGILGVSQLLKGKMTDKEDLENIQVLCNSGEHLLAVLNDILDFSKIEQGKFLIQRSDFKLMELVNAVERIFRPLCVEKKVNFAVNTNIDQNTIVNSDQVRLNQIIFNLVSNAVKFTHQGQVNINIRSKETNDSSRLFITVEDSGIGIDAQRIEHIFDPFVQAEATTTREYGGSGLGLAIVRSLIDLLDGEFELQSEVGKGTRFTVSLPVEIKTECAVAKAPVEPINPSTLFKRSLKVLLVEDNHTNAFIAKAFCEKYAMTVIWVQDGHQAISYLSEHSDVDLVLMDNQLPNLGGIETTKIIREDLGSKVPIYACTADGMQDTKRSFLSVGADYVLVKPLKEQLLNQAFVHFKDTFMREVTD